MRCFAARIVLALSANGLARLSTSPSVPTDIVFQVLLCRLRYKPSFRDISELFLLRGFEFTHETVRDWEERFAPVFAQQLRAKR